MTYRTAVSMIEDVLQFDSHESCVIVDGAGVTLHAPKAFQLYYDDWARLMFPASSEVWFRWLAIPNNPGGSNYLLFEEITAGNGTHIHIAMNYAGDLVVKRGDHNGTTIASAVGAVNGDKVRVITGYVKVADSGGRVVVKNSGTTLIDYTGDTRNGGSSGHVESVMVRVPGGTHYCTFEEITLSTHGELKVGYMKVLDPVANGTYQQFAASAGSAYECIDENPPSDADYIYRADSATGEKSTFAMGDLAMDPTSIGGIVVATRTTLSDTGESQIKHAILSGGTYAAGSAMSIPNNAVWKQSSWLTDPNTGAAWTKAGVNAVEAGVEVA